MDNHYYAADYSIADDKFVYPDGCLINKLGLRSTKELNLAEVEFSKRRLAQLSEKPILGRFDLSHLQAIHRHIFQDVYPCAGETRTVDIGKGDTLFLPFKKIESVFRKITADLESEKLLQGLSEQDFANKLGDYFGRINTTHPFREGNGRTQRVFTQHIARQAGYVLDWSAVGNDAMRNACIAHKEGDTSRLARLIVLNITPIKTIEVIHQAALSPSSKGDRER